MANCSNCNGTGKSPGSDYLDCTHCEAASQIAVRGRLFRDDMVAPGTWMLDPEIAALAASLNEMWGWAIQVGEQFTPDHDDADKAAWRMQCDAAQALLKNYPRKP